MERASLLTPQSVRDAAAHLGCKVHKTPVYGSPHLSKLASGLGSLILTEPGVNIHLIFKFENMQATGSFKFRGATNFMLNLCDEKLKLGVVTYSTGMLSRDYLTPDILIRYPRNHAAATACAAKTLSEEKGFPVPCTVVMPNYAAEHKAEAARRYGAKVLLHGSSIVEASRLAEAIQQETGATLARSSGHPDIILGQGTAVLEFVDQVEESNLHPLDAIVVPCGSGGLLSGASILRKEYQIGVFGTEPAEGGPDLQRGRREAQHVAATDVSFVTVADGLRTPVSEYTWEFLREPNAFDGVYSATEEEIKTALRLLFEEMKMVIEPSAAVPLAAVLFNGELRRYFAKLKRDWTIGIIVSGGNTTVEKIMEILG